jgi:cytochrome b6-f complex iron-sulfur subunit
LNRKSFLQRALSAWSTIVSLPILYGIVRYLAPAQAGSGPPVEVTIHPGSDAVPIRMVRHGDTPFFLKQEGGRAAAFSARCSHLGCVVQYLEESKRFRCNCHGSLFDENGVNLTGPATRPLQPYRVETRGDDIVVTVG